MNQALFYLLELLNGANGLKWNLTVIKYQSVLEECI